jgi:hypothetical protein
MGENLMPWLPKLTAKDRQNIALAIRCCGPENNWLKRNFSNYEAAADASMIALLNRKEAMAALRKLAHFYRPADDTINKLRRRRGWWCNALTLG